MSEKMRAEHDPEHRALIVLVIFAAGIVLFRWAWLVSHRHGVPLLSRATWDELKIYVAVAAILVGARVAWFWARKGFGKHDHQP
jgi:hypothetical protein